MISDKLRQTYGHVLTPIFEEVMAKRLPCDPQSIIEMVQGSDCGEEDKQQIIRSIGLMADWQWIRLVNSHYNPHSEVGRVRNVRTLAE